jgi:hypothetical protein
VSTDANVGRLDGREPPTVNSVKGRGGRRWCVLLAATMACAVLFSLSASERAGANSPVVCPNGVIVWGGQPCPYVPPVNYKTSPLKGTVVGANHQTVFCPDGSYVSRVGLYADPVNIRTSGAQVYCRSMSGVESAVGPVIGRSSNNYSTVAACPNGNTANGILGGSNEVVYRFGLRCYNLATAAESQSTVVGWPWTGAWSGPFDCAHGTWMVGLTGESAPFSGLGAGGYNITALWADCHQDPYYTIDNTLTNYREVPPPSIGAAPPPRMPAAKRYRASSARGTVRLKLIASHATSGAWYYAIEKLALPAGCGRVPGGFVANRRSRSQHARFHASRPGFRVAGYVLGALAKPKVHATVTVTKGVCTGEAISFTARPS